MHAKGLRSGYRAIQDTGCTPVVSLPVLSPALTVTSQGCDHTRDGWPYGHATRSVTQEARIFSHGGPIRHRKRGYIPTADQSLTGRVGCRQDGGAGVERGLDTCLCQRDGLLLHSLVDRNLRGGGGWYGLEPTAQSHLGGLAVLVRGFSTFE
eukprot:1185066-Prorocentrum_minimum.AAC.2